jgi:hypothetical protein
MKGIPASGSADAVATGGVVKLKAAGRAPTLRFWFLGVLQKILYTIRLLATKTNNLVGELWNYTENGKPSQCAIVILAGRRSGTPRAGTTMDEAGI